MNLTEIRQLLDQRGIQLTKSLGQNFLHDGNQLKRIAGAAELEAGDSVLEIGPGLGPLTELLIESAARVHAVEMDARMIPVLQERFAGKKNFELAHGDGLELVRDQTRDWSEWKLVSNLPYSVGSPILVELAQNPRGPRRMVATLQREVVDRLRAKPDTSEYGILTLLVQARYAVVRTFPVPRGCFFPQPDVDSSCIVLDRRKPALVEGELAERFDRVVKLAFSQRRKMMMKLLRAVHSDEQLAKGFAAAAISETERAERVSLEQFVKLTAELAG